MGLVNLFWEPTAAGKGGEEWSAATRLMRQIHELISAFDLEREVVNNQVIKIYIFIYINRLHLRGLEQEYPPVGRLQAEHVRLLGVVGGLLGQRVVHTDHFLLPLPSL